MSEPGETPTWMLTLTPATREWAMEMPLDVLAHPILRVVLSEAAADCLPLNPQLRARIVGEVRQRAAMLGAPTAWKAPALLVEPKMPEGVSAEDARRQFGAYAVLVGPLSIADANDAVHIGKRPRWWMLRRQWRARATRRRIERARIPVE